MQPQAIEAGVIEADLRARGYACVGPLLQPEACGGIAGLYDAPEHFRSRIDMRRYRFGRGEYQYFNYPLPSPIGELRASLYATLAPIASRWVADLRMDATFPPELPAFLEQCHAAGQTRPTPLLLRYGPDDFNCLHQDLYGNVVFPFQVIIGLSRSGADYRGGELLLVEQQPRAQSIGHVISLEQGHGVAITTRYRPVQGARGFYRTNIRHGVSAIHSGQRFTLGIIFHDAE
jgi:uncharacterized protein